MTHTSDAEQRLVTDLALVPCFLADFYKTARKAVGRFRYDALHSFHKRQRLEECDHCVQAGNRQCFTIIQDNRILGVALVYLHKHGNRLAIACDAKHLRYEFAIRRPVSKAQRILWLLLLEVSQQFLADHLGCLGLEKQG